MEPGRIRAPHLNIWERLRVRSFANGSEGGAPFAGGLSPARESHREAQDKAAYILVVEDNSGDAELLRWALEEHEVAIEVLVVSDGEQAIRHLEAVDAATVHCPSLIILDLNLPKRNGLEVLKMVRASALCGTAPVAIFSSSNAPIDVRESQRLGANLYIRKPSNLDDFLKVGGQIRSLLESQH